MANKAWFERLAPEDKKLMLEGAAEEARKGRKAVRELAPLLVENFGAAKIQVHRLSEAEKDAFAKACAVVHDKWAAGKGKSAVPMLKKARAALAELRKKS